MNGNSLKVLRMKSGKRLKDVAEQLDVSIQCVQAYEAAKSITFERIEQYARILNDKELIQLTEQIKEKLL